MTAPVVEETVSVDPGLLAREKLEQSPTLLDQHGIDLWLTFVQETGLRPDPALALICPHELTWQSAFLVTRRGERIAILGRYDAPSVEQLGTFNQVVPYDQAIRPALVEALRRLQPARIGLNFSGSDPAADGLSHGLKLVLDEILLEAGIGPERLVSAEGFLASLRGRKTQGEVAAIRRSVKRTERFLVQVGQHIRPGVSENHLAEILHGWMREQGLSAAWSWDSDPIITTGPSDESPGHAAPSPRIVEQGHLVHFDFGLRLDGFCADLQRMWYVLKPDEAQPPGEVQRVWDGVRAALLAGADALQPGKHGWEVDLAARQALVGQGLPEYLHAFGHHLGRAAHDGATVLGPRWERYGQSPHGVVEAGNVFAIELGAPVPGHGWVYLEEDVYVGESGLEWLSNPQTELRLVTA